MRPLPREEYPMIILPSSFTVFKSPIFSPPRVSVFRFSRGEFPTRARLCANKVLGHAMEDAVRIGVCLASCQPFLQNGAGLGNGETVSGVVTKLREGVSCCPFGMSGWRGGGG
jgi:hypothetical protein